MLDDELQLPDFRSMHGKDWFQKFLTPAEEIDEEDMEGEDGEEDEASGDEDDEGEDEEE